VDVVGAFACSHAALLLTRADQAPEKQRRVIYDAFAEMGRTIVASKPDAIVIVGTDHGRIYPLSQIPQYPIGVSSLARGIGDAGLPLKNIRSHQAFARQILTGCLAAGIDLAYSEAMSIDHSFLTPLLLSLPELDIPIVPLVQNCNAPPLPTLRRSHAVGEALGEAIRRGQAGRVVVIGTGGLSHWVGSPAFQSFMTEPAGTRIERQKEYPLTLPDTGHVNEEFDRAFIDMICQGRAREFVDEWDTERLRAAAGNGAQEVRNWLLLAGVVRDRPGRLIAYEPVKEWLTGTAIVQLAHTETGH
jgi:aromatic ring-opening dioxygenase catalytic subunit (LigB family)